MIVIRPLGANVAVRLEPLTGTTSSGLHLAESRSVMRWGTIESVGEFCRLVAVGQTVLVNSLAGQEVHDLLVLPETAIALTNP